MNHELEGFKRAFYLTERNSDPEKYAVWAGLVVTVVVVVGIMFGGVTVETGPQEYIWEAVKVGVAAMFGRVWGKESDRVRRDDT